MPRSLPHFSKTRVLISNDDGIHAPGLKLLAKVIKAMGAEVWVVAPETEQSAASHSLTLRTPLSIRKLGPRRFAVNGTPTDCVLLGINEIMKDTPPDLVLSGVNRGANLGEDVTYSGTIAAAMEGTLIGVPSVAFSLFTDDRAAPRWETAEKWIAPVMQKIAKLSFPANVLINVNIPDVSAKSVAGIAVTVQGKRKIGGALQEGVDPRGDKYFWIGMQRREDQYQKGSDLEAVRSGYISITPLSLDLTHTATLKKLRALFAQDG